MLDTLKKGISILAVLSVVSCGGGSGDNYIVGAGNGGSGSSSGSTTDSTGTTADNRIADLEVAASSRQLGSNGTEPVIISAVVKDANNNILKDVDVIFAVDNNGTIEPDNDTAAGSVKIAKLTPGLNRPENRTLVVTVTAGAQTRSLNVEVTGTAIQLDGPERIVANTPTQFVGKLKDSTGKGLPNQLVLVESANGNTVTPSSADGFYTDADGELLFTVTAAGSGTDTLTASALGTTYSHPLNISGDEFAMSCAQQEINVNSDATVNLIWKQDGVPQANRVIGLTATRGKVPATVITDSNGRASFTLSSPTAGGTVITAIDAQSGLAATLVREFVATVPAYLSVQSERATLAPEEQTTIVALVRDVHDNPVKNQKVNFNLYDVVNGVLSSSTATTDSLGKATVVYTAGNAISAKDGVVIDTVLQNNPNIVSRVTLTVGARALRLVLGADENTEDSGIFYEKGFGVIVTDSAGNPVANKNVDFTLIPTRYYKGYLTCNVTLNKWEPYYTATDGAGVRGCPSEDVDKDGRLDSNEDINGSGFLEPTHTAAVNTRAMTDAQGKAVVTVSHPQSQALWSRVRLVATISDEGSEFWESTEFDLPMTSADMEDCVSAAPNMVSPYGIASSCNSPD